MKAAYQTIITVTNDSKDTCLVEVPQLNILTEGYGMVDAMNMARDAISLAIISKEDNGEPVETVSIISHDTTSVFIGQGEQIYTYVDVDTTEYRRKNDNRSVRRNVTLPNWLNIEAEKAHINVSRVLQEALLEKLNLAK